MDAITKITRSFEKLFVQEFENFLVNINNIEDCFDAKTGKLNIEECMKHVSFTTKKTKKQKQSAPEETDNQPKKMTIAEMRLECKRLGLTNVPKKKTDIQKMIEDEMKRREATEEELENEPEDEEEPEEPEEPNFH